MKRYSKLQPQGSPKTVIKRDRNGNPKTAILPDGKIYFFNSSNKQWVKPQSRLSKKERKRVQNVGIHYEELRKNPTTAEQAFRSILRDSGIQHEFQRPVKLDTGFRYIDFYFPQLRLAIEIDGGYHKDLAQETKDRQREQEILSKLPVTFLRFSNEQVLDKPEVLLEALFDYIRKKLRCKGINLTENEFKPVIEVL